MAYGQKTTTIDYRSDYPPLHNKGPRSKNALGSSACDPVMVLDDDEPDAAKSNYIDLEADGGAFTEENCTASIQQSVAGTHGAGVPTVVKTNSPYTTTQGSDLARRTKRDVSPLFCPLTTDDFSASSVQAVPEKRGIGFKAWYKKIDPYLSVRTVPEMQQKQISKNHSIALVNKQRNQNKTTKDCDAPQLNMNVLKSKRKRTIGELAYNELISPAQIESPSEKLARMAKKRRQHQEKCDLLLQITNAGDLQSAMHSDSMYGHENDGVTGENIDLTENHSDDRMNAYSSRSAQTTDQGSDAQKHSNSITAAYSSDSASRKRRDQKARIGGATKACGVFSPEKKPPVKRSEHGAFHCPRCNSQFTRSTGVNYHFENCVARYGNPKSLRWNDHPSLEGVTKHESPASKVRNTGTTEYQIPAGLAEQTQEDVLNDRKTASASVPGTHGPIDTQIVTPAPLAKMRATPLDSDTRAPTVEHRAIAGKGLSQETLRRFQRTGNWNSGAEMDQYAFETQDEETEVPNIAYHYFVQKREWLETEEDAIESSMGPFYSMVEANAVAKAEVQYPQIDDYEEIQPTGWSYLYEQDENGMQMHRATVLEIHIEMAVHRTLVPANKRVSVPKSAFIVAPRVFVVHEVQWLPTSPDVTTTAPSHHQLLTHGAYTMLNKANQRASAEFLETLTGNWGHSDYDLLKKAEMKSDLDKKVRVLKQENDCFCEEIKLDNHKSAKVWVELVVVEGPRN